MATISAAPVADPTTIDQLVTLQDVTWAEFELILAIRGDKAGIRMTYLDGVLELMSPCFDHEVWGSARCGYGATA